MKPLIIDVGANFGEFALTVALNSPDSLVLAIEPLQPCIDALESSIEKDRLKNLILVQKCISKEGGIVNLNFINSGDLGLTSLLKLKNPEDFKDPYWQSRQDVINPNWHQLQVESLSLESLLSEMSFSEIAFIKIDVQGKDLEVLSSAGRFIEKIQAGMLEVSSTKETTLYEDEGTVLDALQLLESLNFKVVSIKPNDPASNEFNIFFARKGIDWLEHLNRFNLDKNLIVTGKNYWHIPSSSVELPEYSPTEAPKKIYADCDFSPSQPNFLLTEEEKEQFNKGVELNSDNTLYVDITDLINHAKFANNVNGIQRVVFEFAKYANEKKNVHYMYLNPLDGNAYYLENLNLIHEVDLSFARNLWFLNLDYLAFCKKQSEYLDGKTRKLVQKLLRFSSWPLIKGLLICTIRNHIQRNYPVKRKFVAHRLEELKEGDVVASFGGIWNFQSDYACFHQKHKGKAFFVNFLHDMIPLVKENFSLTKLNNQFKKYLPYILKHSDLIITSTHNNILDLKSVANKYHPDLPVPKTVPVGLFYGFGQIMDQEAKQSELRSNVRQMLENKYVLCVGSIEPRKNHLLLLQAWRKFNLSNDYNGEMLVLAGGWGNGVEYLKKSLHYTGHFNNTVLVIEKPTDIELLALYKNCKFTVYPTHYEGWGLPISESIYFGKPVVHFNNSCLTEVSVGAAYIVEDLQSMIKAFRELFGDDDIYWLYKNRIQYIKENLPTCKGFAARILKLL